MTLVLFFTCLMAENCTSAGVMTVFYLAFPRSAALGFTIFSNAAFRAQTLPTPVLAYKLDYNLCFEVYIKCKFCLVIFTVL